MKLSPYFHIIKPIIKNLANLETMQAEIKIKKLIPMNPLERVITLNGIGVKPPIKT